MKGIFQIKKYVVYFELLSFQSPINNSFYRLIKKKGGIDNICVQWMHVQYIPNKCKSKNDNLQLNQYQKCSIEYLFWNTLIPIVSGLK